MCIRDRAQSDRALPKPSTAVRSALTRSTISVAICCNSPELSRIVVMSSPAEKNSRYRVSSKPEVIGVSERSSWSKMCIRDRSCPIEAA